LRQIQHVKDAPAEPGEIIQKAITYLEKQRPWIGSYETDGFGLRLGGEGQVLGLRNQRHLGLKFATYSEYATKVMVAGRCYDPKIDIGKTSQTWTWKDRQAEPS
jgi:hypothetical protein